VPEANTCGDAAGDKELTTMRCPVMHTAKSDNTPIFGIRMGALRVFRAADHLRGSPTAREPRMR
jgi:hypothetical protein